VPGLVLHDTPEELLVAGVAAQELAKAEEVQDHRLARIIWTW